MKRVIGVVLAVSLVVALGCAKQADLQGKDEPAEIIAVEESLVVVDEVHSTMLGYIIDHMDQYDKEKMVYAFENANKNIPFEWENPENGKSYRITLFSDEAAEENRCKMVEIFSAETRLKACAVVKQDPERGWLIKSENK